VENSHFCLADFRMHIFFITQLKLTKNSIMSKGLINLIEKGG